MNLFNRKNNNNEELAIDRVSRWLSNNTNELEDISLPSLAKKIGAELDMPANTAVAALYQLRNSGNILLESGNRSKGDYSYSQTPRPAVAPKVKKQTKKIKVTEIKEETPEQLRKKELEAKRFAYHTNQTDTVVPVKVENKCDGKNITINVSLTITL